MQFNLADMFESLADAIPDRPALVSGKTRLTFGELDRRANRLANFLKARGVEPGQHIGLHLYNGAEFVESMLAAYKLRAVPINLNYRYVAAELKYLCDNADLVAIVSQRELSPVVAGATTLPITLLVEDGSGVTAPGSTPSTTSRRSPAARRSAISSRAPATTSTSSTPAARPACRAA